jgi:YHS domain-containing protein
MAYLVRFLLLGLLFVLIARSFWQFLGSIVEGASGRPRSRSGPPDRGVAMVRDPVCGTFVLPSNALTLAAPDGPIYFCSEQCRKAYRAGPASRAGVPR